MEKRTLVVEILKRDETLIERHKVSSFPVSIGRAYDNDIIIADKYVCPKHLSLEIDEENNIKICNQSETNGTLELPLESRIDSVTFTGITTVRAGDTFIRLIDPSIGVEKALPKKRTQSLYIDHKPIWWGYGIISLILYSVLRVGVFRYLSYQDKDNTAVDTLVLTLAIYIPMFIIWAGGWAILSKLVTKRANFTKHLFVVLIVTASYSAIYYLLKVAEYSFGYFSITYLGSFLLLPALLILSAEHLRYATNMSRKRRWASCSVVIAFIGVLAAVYTYSQSFEFNNAPPTQLNIKPSYLQLSHEKSIEQFASSIFVLNDSLVTELNSQE